MTLPNLGEKLFIEICDALFTAWASVDLPTVTDHTLYVASAEDGANAHSTSGLTAALNGDLLILLRWHWADRGAVTIAEVLDTGLVGAPQDVADAAARIAMTPLEDLLGVRALDDLHWDELLELTEREMTILRGRIFPLGAPSTLVKLGEELGVTRERVRQLEQLLRRKIQERMAGPAGESLRHAASRLARRMGSVIEPQTAERLLDDIVGNPNEAEVELRRSILRSMCGPYVEFAGLLWSPDAENALQVLQRRLDDFAPGALLPSELDETLTTLLEPLDEDEAALVQEALGVRWIGAHLVLWTGSMADKATACLGAAEKPMTMFELHQAVGDRCNPRSFSNQVQTDDRMMRLGKDLYGLRAWGGEEYSGILDELEQAIERRGGSAKLAELIDQFVEDFGVSASSVRAYAADTRFVRVGEGAIRLRVAGDPEPTYTQRPLATTPGLFRIDDVWHFRVEVDEDALRGSGRQVRNAVASAAGIEPDLSLGFDYEGTTVLFTWARKQPSMGSIRPLLLRHSCVLGDLLFLPLAGEEPRVVRIVRAASLNRETGLRRLPLEMGIEGEIGDDPLARVAQGLDLPAGADWHDIVDRLEDRRERTLVDLIPDIRR